MSTERRPHTKTAVHLWEFLLDLLSDERYAALIGWTNRAGGEFKLKNQEEVARKWGDLKHRPSMNYDKLSRALRYYYQKGIIKKVNGQRLVYKFCNPPSMADQTPLKPSSPPPLIPINDSAYQARPSPPLTQQNIAGFPTAAHYIPISVPMSPLMNSRFGIPVLSTALRMPSDDHVTYQYMLPVIVPRCQPVSVITKS